MVPTAFLGFNKAYSPPSWQMILSFPKSFKKELKKD